MFQTNLLEKIKIRISCPVMFFLKSCLLRYKVEKYSSPRHATDGNIIRRMRFACWITKATDTHSECVILIAFPRQQWLRERVSVLRYTYTDSCFEFTTRSPSYDDSTHWRTSTGRLLTNLGSVTTLSFSYSLTSYKIKRQNCSFSCKTDT
jgi:hypothetical protein